MKRGPGRKQFAQGHGTDPGPAGSRLPEPELMATRVPSHAPNTNTELAAAPLPPGPGLSAQGWGAKPRE